MLNHAAAGANAAVARRSVASPAVQLTQGHHHGRRRAPPAPPPRAEPAAGGGGGGPAAGGLSEDVLARLRAAEQEAARLREELASVQAANAASAAFAAGAAAPSSTATAAGGDGANAAAAAPVRIDSTDSRELPWTSGKRTAWLSEADVTFFTGAGATEGSALRDGGGAGGGAGSAAGGAAEADGVVRRRLLQGAAATALLAAFALVPTSALRLGAPAKPLFFYLVPLVRVLDQLRDLEPAVEDADWTRLRAARALIVGPPGNARDNMFDAIAALEGFYKSQEAQSGGGGAGGGGGGGSAKKKGLARRAEQLAAEVVEALDALDYNKYFDSAMLGAAPSGAQNAEFVRFTREARKAAVKGLGEFLGLMPREAVDGARQAVEQQRAAMASM